MNERIVGILREITTSPLSIEIIYTALQTLSGKAGCSDDQLYDILFGALVDWDK